MASVLSDDINRIPRRNCSAIARRNYVRFRRAFGQQIHVVPIASSRGVSDPRTDPGVGVRGPEVGSLTPRLLSGACHWRGEGRRAVSIRVGAASVRMSNVRQEQSSTEVAAIIGRGRVLSRRIGEHA
jgi:hypothetical protein